VLGAKENGATDGFGSSEAVGGDVLDGPLPATQALATATAQIITAINGRMAPLPDGDPAQTGQSGVWFLPDGSPQIEGHVATSEPS